MTTKKQSRERGFPVGETLQASQLKALAHPTRLAIDRELRRVDHARATDLSSTLGEPVNKVSFHLRVLADAGFIEEAPEHARDGRDRVWRAAKRAWTLVAPDSPTPDEALSRTVLTGLLGETHNLLDRAATWAEEYSAGRVDGVHATLSFHTLALTDAQLEELMVGVDKLTARFTGATSDADGPRKWRFVIAGVDSTL